MCPEHVLTAPCSGIRWAASCAPRAVRPPAPALVRVDTSQLRTEHAAALARVRTLQTQLSGGAMSPEAVSAALQAVEASLAGMTLPEAEAHLEAPLDIGEVPCMPAAGAKRRRRDKSRTMRVMTTAAGVRASVAQALRHPLALPAPVAGAAVAGRRSSRAPHPAARAGAGSAAADAVDSDTSDEDDDDDEEVRAEEAGFEALHRFDAEFFEELADAEAGSGDDGSGEDTTYGDGKDEGGE